MVRRRGDVRRDYKAAYSGLLKVSRLLRVRLCAARRAALASGGSVAHLLALDYALKPVLCALGARDILDAVFATDAQIPQQGPLGFVPSRGGAPTPRADAAAAVRARRRIRARRRGCPRARRAACKSSSPTTAGSLMSIGAIKKSRSRRSGSIGDDLSRSDSPAGGSGPARQRPGPLAELAAVALPARHARAPARLGGARPGSLGGAHRRCPCEPTAGAMDRGRTQLRRPGPGAAPGRASTGCGST